jgi:hypothetical protein
MFKTLIMTECDQCNTVFPEIISQTNNVEVPLFRLFDVVLHMDQAGWRTDQAASAHICYECCRHFDNSQQEELETSCPF